MFGDETLEKMPKREKKEAKSTPKAIRQHHFSPLQPLIFQIKRTTPKFCALQKNTYSAIQQNFFRSKNRVF